MRSHASAPIVIGADTQRLLCFGGPLHGYVVAYQSRWFQHPVIVGRGWATYERSGDLYLYIGGADYIRDAA